MRREPRRFRGVHSISVSTSTPDIPLIVRGSEWDGPAALPPPTALRVRGGLVRRRSTAMPRTTTVHAVTNCANLAHGRLPS